MVSDSDKVPDTKPDRSKRMTWSKIKRPAFIAVIGLVAVVIVVVAVMQLSKSGADTEPAPTGDAEASNTEYMTAQEQYRFENVRRIDGVVATIDGDRLQLRLSDGEVLDLELLSNTHYSSGSGAAPAERSVIKTGKKIVLTYDTSNGKVESAWVDYDVESNS